MSGSFPVRSRWAWPSLGAEGSHVRPSVARGATLDRFLGNIPQPMAQLLRPQNPPFLRWAGSKRRLVPTLAKYWDSDAGCYLEPFMGSAVLFFALQPKRAVLGDINDRLVETFQVVRDSPTRVAALLANYPRRKRLYYRLRRTHFRGRIQRAAQFIYLNRYCFNGLYRTDRAGRFNVPYSPLKTGQLPRVGDLHSVSKVLSGATVLQSDFEAIALRAKRGDFVYLDPPYAVENRRIFRQYAGHLFGSSDLGRLKEVMRRLDDRGARFVVSYALSSESLALATGWHSKRFRTQRNISGFAKHRREAVELVISNFEPK
jgi:DNA adenine methylase